MEGRSINDSYRYENMNNFTYNKKNINVNYTRMSFIYDWGGGA